jgi:mRNA interferase MazF
MNRGEIWWADLEDPAGSGRGYRHPVVIIQADKYNTSALKTVIVAVVSSNLNLARAPGNILLTSAESKLPKDSVINVSQIITVDKSYLSSFVGSLRPKTLLTLNESLKSVMDL